MTVVAAAPAPITVRSQRVGIVAVVGALVCFSVASSILKKADAPGVVVAFWRLIFASLIWNAVLFVQGRRLTASIIRTLWLPGLMFGLNMALFFTAVRHTSIAHAEFLGALSPLVLIPAGAKLFHERIDPRSMLWGGIAVVGIALVLFAGPADGVASWKGDVLVLGGVGAWAIYLLSAKRARAVLDVAELMACIAPFAALAQLPIVIGRGDGFGLPAAGWVAVGILTVTTGIAAHAMLLFAQRYVPVATIGVMQVGQPALAVVWAFLLLSEEIRPAQVLGMALVLLGLGLFTWSSESKRRAAEPAISSAGGGVAPAPATDQP